MWMTSHWLAAQASLARGFRAAVLLLAAAMFQPPPATAADAPPPVTVPVPLADFFKVPQMGQPVLSPSGKHLAVHVGTASGRVALAVIAVDPPRDAKLVAGFSDGDVMDVHWVDDQRLVFHIGDRESPWAENQGRALLAADRDGSGLRRLISNSFHRMTTGTHIANRELTPNHGLLRTLRDGSADVLVERQDHDIRGEPTQAALLRLDTRTGIVRRVDVDPPNLPLGFVADSAGEVRVLKVRNGADVETLWRPRPSEPWQSVDKHPLFKRFTGQFGFMEVAADGHLYVRSVRNDAAGTDALYRFDPKTLKLPEQPLVGLDGFDYQGRLLFDGRSRSLIGVRYLSDTWGTAWLRDDMKALQAKVDKRLPGTVNLLDPAECGCTRWMVVTAYTDRQPSQFFLYDSEADTLEPIGSAQPQIDRRRMAERDFVRVPARDGLPLPLHITRPAGKGPWPTVVLVHGGPNVRGGVWGWHGDSQFLASRGYLVLEPEFRGSTGYGALLESAGHRQWGMKMQDDIADVARWAIAKGQADPRRVCIAGASYGGYATLMGLIKDPDLYRCGVAWVAVTDLPLMLDGQGSDMSDAWLTYGLRDRVGDPVKDAEQLRATSPAYQADRLKQPLLMAIGGQDRRVLPEQGVRMRDALRKAGSPPEWVDYPDEGHGFLAPANKLDFWRRVEAFLARHLAAP